MQNFLPFWFHLDINYYYYSFKRRLKCSWLSRFTSQKCPPVLPPHAYLGLSLMSSFYSEIGTNESPGEGQLNMKLLTTHFVTKRWCDSNLAPFCELVMEIWCEAFMESICPALPSHEHPAQIFYRAKTRVKYFHQARSRVKYPARIKSFNIGKQISFQALW